MIKLLPLIEEGIINQSRIDAFLSVLESKLKNKKFKDSVNFIIEFNEEMDVILKDIFKLIYNDNAIYVHNEIVQAGYIKNNDYKLYIYPSTAGIGIEHGFKNVVQLHIEYALIISSELQEKVYYAHSEHELSKLLYQLNVIPSFNENFKSKTIPKLLDVLKHELTHYEQVYKWNESPKKTHSLKYGNHEKEYFYDQMEIGAYANQFAYELIKHNIPLEKLKDRKYMMKKFKDFDVLTTKKHYYFEINNKYSKKFWKYVYFYLDKYYKEKN